MNNMTNSNHPDQQVWKHEQQREARKARHAAEMRANGEKAPIREPHSKLRRIVFPIVAALVILAILIWGAFNLGLPQRFFHPLKVGQRPVSVVEYTYFYNTAYQQYSQYAAQGMLPLNAEGKIDMNALTGIPEHEKQTWGEYLDEITQLQIKRIEILNHKAESLGMTLSEQNQKSIDQQIEQAIQHYGTRVKAENGLVRSFGRGMTLDHFRALMGKVLLAQQFNLEYPKTHIEVTDDEIETYYQENKDKVDVLDYRSFTLSLPAPTEEEAKLSPDEQEKHRKDAMAKLKESAETFLAGVTDEASFIEQAKAFADPQEKAAYEDEKRTLHQGESSDQLAINPAAQWLLDPARKAGDTTLSEGARSYQVTYFLKRYREEVKLPTVGRLVFQVNQAPDQSSPAALEAQKQAQDAMKALAEKSLEAVNDQASLEAEAKRLEGEGETVIANWQEHAPLVTLSDLEKTWALDPARKPGDKILLPTTQGYEIFFFAQAGERPAWQQQVVETLKRKKMGDLIDEWEKDEAYNLTTSWIGMKLTDKFATNTKTGEQVIQASLAAAQKEPKASADAADAAGQPGQTGSAQTESAAEQPTSTGR